MPGIDIAWDVIPLELGWGRHCRNSAWTQAWQSILFLDTYVDNVHVWVLPSHQPGWQA